GRGPDELFVLGRAVALDLVADDDLFHRNLCVLGDVRRTVAPLGTHRSLAGAALGRLGGRPRKRPRTVEWLAGLAGDPSLCRAAERCRELRARAQVELAKDAAEVGLDGAQGNEERLGDLAIAEPFGGHGRN